MNGLSKYYIRKIINCFSLEFTATETSRKLKINRNTVNKYYRIIREAVVDYQEVQYKIQRVPKYINSFYFSWNKNQGLTRALQEDTISFGIEFRGDRVYVQHIDSELIRSKFGQETLQHFNQEENYFLTELISSNLFLDKKKENAETIADSSGVFKNQSDTANKYFNYAQQKLTKFYGVKEQYTYMYLKELEFRFNNQGRDLSKLIWRILPHHSEEWNRTSKHRR